MRTAAPRLRLAAVVVTVATIVAGVAVGSCDCTGNVAPSSRDAGVGFCVDSSDCSFNARCVDGVCEAPLPVEGEGEGAEGEGAEGEEGEGEEGEGEGADTGFVIAPPDLILPPAAVGATSTSTAQIVNTGDVTVSITSVSSNNAAFRVDAPAVGASVAAANSISLVVTFAPTTAGAQSATTTVVAGGTTRTLAVSSSTPQVVADGALLFSAGPDDDGLGLAACECKAPVSPANVDVRYEAAGGSCQKPSNIGCGISDSCAPCNLGAQGSARWRSARTEQPRQGDEPWIVDEEVVHDGAGADGEFSLRAVLVDDCVATVGSIGRATNDTCCRFIDCGGAFACYDWSDLPSCNDCQGFVTSAMAADCLARGPVLVRAKVTVDDVERHFCALMTEGDNVEVARVRRTAGAFSIVSLGNVDEVDPGDPCP
jgi:hypothetical protein